MKKNRRTNNKRMIQNFKLLVGLLATLGLLGILIYSTNSKTEVVTQKQTPTQAIVRESAEKDQNTINCAQKIDQDDTQAFISQKPGEVNCLYLGCGGFFQ